MLNPLLMTSVNRVLGLLVAFMGAAASAPSVKVMFWARVRELWSAAKTRLGLVKHSSQTLSLSASDGIGMSEAFGSMILHHANATIDQQVVELRERLEALEKRADRSDATTRAELDQLRAELQTHRTDVADLRRAQDVAAEAAATTQAKGYLPVVAGITFTSLPEQLLLVNAPHWAVQCIFPFVALAVLAYTIRLVVKQS